MNDPFAFSVKSSSLPRVCRLIGLGTVYFVTPSYIVTERLRLTGEVASFPQEPCEERGTATPPFSFPHPIHNFW